MELQERSEMHEIAAVAFADDAEDDDVQRCVSETRSLPEPGGAPGLLRKLEARIGEMLATPLISLMSQVALELEVLV